MNEDLCPACGLEIRPGDPNQVGHWDTPYGATLVAWTHGGPCSASLEGDRIDGRLEVAR